MTKQEYLEYKQQNPFPYLQYYFEKNGGTKVPLPIFQKSLLIWTQMLGFGAMERLIEGVEQKLDKEFNIK